MTSRMTRASCRRRGATIRRGVHVVLHRDHADASARRQLHRVRPRPFRTRRRADDRSGPRGQRGTHGPDRAHPRDRRHRKQVARRFDLLDNFPLSDFVDRKGARETQRANQRRRKREPADGSQLAPRYSRRRLALPQRPQLGEAGIGRAVNQCLSETLWKSAHLRPYKKRARRP